MRLRTAIVLLIVGFILFSGGLSLLFITETVHEYSVKAEVVDNSSVEEATHINEIDDNLSRMLFDAYKQEDHFFGETAVTETFDAQFDATSWQVVEVDGVMLLVAVDGPNTEEEIPGYSALGIPLVLVSLVPLLMGLDNLYEWRCRKR